MTVFKVSCKNYFFANRSQFLRLSVCFSRCLPVSGLAGGRRDRFWAQGDADIRFQLVVMRKLISLFS
jgi:hypothetical protein